MTRCLSLSFWLSLALSLTPSLSISHHLCSRIMIIYEPTANIKIHQKYESIIQLAYDNNIESAILSLLFKYYEIFILYMPTLHQLRTITNRSFYSHFMYDASLSSLFINPTTRPSTSSSVPFIRQSQVIWLLPQAICISIRLTFSNYHFTIFVMESNPLVYHLHNG